MKLYIKSIYVVFFLLACDIAYASDTTGVTGLDQTVSVWQQILKVCAKWGGIVMFVICAWMIGSGKAKGEAVSWITWVLAAAGIVEAGFVWYPTIFTSGFVF